MHVCNEAPAQNSFVCRSTPCHSWQKHALYGPAIYSRNGIEPHEHPLQREHDEELDVDVLVILIDLGVGPNFVGMFNSRNPASPPLLEDAEGLDVDVLAILIRVNPEWGAKVSRTASHLTLSN